MVGEVSVSEYSDNTYGFPAVEEALGDPQTARDTAEVITGRPIDSHDRSYNMALFGDGNHGDRLS